VLLAMIHPRSMNKRNSTVRPLLRRITIFALSGILFPSFARALSSGFFEIELISGGSEVEITGYFGSEEMLTIPIELEGKPVTRIRDSAFYARNNLTRVAIPHSVTRIGDAAFYSCNSLVSVAVPASVTHIGHGAFGACLSLTDIEVDPANPDFQSVNGVLFNADRTLLHTYPAGFTGPYSIPDSVIKIGNSAFHYCRNLSQITIPSSVTQIGDYAFFSCTSLPGITLPYSVTSIGDFAFGSCFSVSNVMIPASVTRIGGGAFGGCHGVTNIEVEPTNPAFKSVDGVLFNSDQTVLYGYPAGRAGTYSVPESVSAIGNGAFFDCINLTGITIPDSVTDIGSSVFRFCRMLTNIAIPDSVSRIGDSAFYYCSGLVEVSLPRSTTSLEDLVFYRCTKLTDLTIPSTVTKIGDRAFEACARLAHLQLPDSISTIGEGAFRDCRALRSITFPSALESLEDSAFINCGSLVSAYFRGDAPAFFGVEAFDFVGPNFTVYYRDTATGFASPSWHDYPATAISAIDPGFAHWRGFHGIPVDANATDDLNGDGVSLLMAYALNLDPHDDLAGSSPVAVSQGGNLEIDFFAGRSDVTYRAETSTDLGSWTDTGVTLSALEANGFLTASVPRTSSAHFLRLIVEEQ